MTVVVSVLIKPALIDDLPFPVVQPMGPDEECC
jgi:hypothetical protein